ncbi:MAG: metallophosphoesterase [Bacteroidota bacterium]
MKIIQITDLHVGKENEDTFGVDVRVNCANILAKAKTLRPDVIVFTGDMCFRDPQRGIYEWLFPQIDALQIPYKVISGNHDDSPMMAQVFKQTDLLKEGELYYKEKWGDWPVLFLDTSTAYLSQPQLKWVEKQLSKLEDKVLIFMHHPPIKCGVSYMDNKHAMQHKKQIQKLIYAFPGQVNVFCGHYHVEKVIRSQNMLLHVTPSCFFQISQQHEHFEPDHRRIGLREITLEGNQLMSTVHYYKGKKLT